MNPVGNVLGLGFRHPSTLGTWFICFLYLSRNAVGDVLGLGLPHPGTLAMQFLQQLQNKCKYEHNTFSQVDWKAETNNLKIET